MPEKAAFFHPNQCFLFTSGEKSGLIILRNPWRGAWKIAISSFDFRAAAKVSEFAGKIK